MNVQNYASHRRFVPVYHAVLLGLIVIAVAGSLINLFLPSDGGRPVYTAWLILVLNLIVLLLYHYSRRFPLKAQDRAIRAEENLRHFVLTGKLLDPRLTMRQIIGLRFASDEEFAELARRAVETNMSEEEIKKAIRSWRGDYYRV